MSDRGYTDPQLWIRLGPKLRELLTNAEQNILQKRVENYESYADAMGYVRGLRDVFKLAEELQKIEPNEEWERENRRQAATNVQNTTRDIWGRMD